MNPLTIHPGTTLTDSEALAAAVSYAEAGWPVYPIHPAGKGPDGSGKIPAVTEWNKAATTDLETVERWWGETRRGHNIGLVVPASVVIVDIDQHTAEKDGAAYLERLESEYGPLPETLTAHTGGGGLHRYYLRPVTVRPLDLMALAPYGIDLLTDGHGAILPPSVSSFGPYWWVDPLAEIVALPDWFITRITKPAPQRAYYVAPRRPEFHGASPIDRFEARFTWREVLTAMVPNAWQVFTGSGDSDGDTYSHPEASGRASAALKHGRLFCFSTSTALPVTATSDPNGLTRFSAWRILNGYTMAEARETAQRLTGGK